MSSLYIRGSRSRSSLKPIPADGLIFDEVDEMTVDTIPIITASLATPNVLTITQSQTNRKIFWATDWTNAGCPGPCDVADKFLQAMRIQHSVVKMSAPIDSPIPKCDTIVLTPAAFMSLDRDALQFRIGRLLIIVGLVPENVKLALDEFYLPYATRTGYTVYSRRRPPLEI